MTNEIQIVDADEIAHAQRTEQMGIIYQELNHLTEQPMTQQSRELIGLLWQRIEFVNEQAEIQEQRSQHWQAIAAGTTATAVEMQRQRDATLDELSEYINAVRSGQHPDVKALIERAEIKAFEEYHANAGRLIALAEKIKTAEKKGA